MKSASAQNAENMLNLEHQHLQIKPQSPPSSSSRILDIPCKVCGDFSSGKHYNIFACDGCAGFFKRSIRRNRQYVCKEKEEGRCVIDKTHRNQCRACRLQKCEEAGMNRDAVQHERGPRNATLRRQQISNYFYDARERLMMAPPAGVLNLAVPKSSTAPRLGSPFPIIPPAGYFCNTMPTMPRMPVAFPPPIPSFIPPPVLSPAVICESAARLLFMNVQWAKSIASFTSLPFSDQLLLLEESWRELFVLGSAQFLPSMDLSSLVPASEVLARKDDPSAFLQSVKEFQDILANIRQFQLDQHEFTCLRSMVLLKTSFEKSSSSSSPSQVESKVLTDPAKISGIQDETQLTLHKYISTTYPGQPLRFAKLLLLVPSLRNVSGDTIEQLFFKKTIGHIPIVRIICDMYKSQSGNNL